MATLMTDDELDWLGLVLLERAAALRQLVYSADMTISEAIAGLIKAMAEMAPQVHCRCVCAGRRARGDERIHTSEHGVFGGRHDDKRRARRGSHPADKHRPPAFTDEALALRFAERHAGELRYVAAWAKWLIWDGKQWRTDETLKAFDLARRICREAAAQCNKEDRRGARKRQDGRRGGATGEGGSANSPPPSTDGTRTRGC